MNMKHLWHRKYKYFPCLQLYIIATLIKALFITWQVFLCPHQKRRLLPGYSAFISLSFINLSTLLTTASFGWRDGSWLVLNPSCTVKLLSCEFLEEILCLCCSVRASIVEEDDTQWQHFVSFFIVTEELRSMMLKWSLFHAIEFG